MGTVWVVTAIALRTISFGCLPALITSLLWQSGQVTVIMVIDQFPHCLCNLDYTTLSIPKCNTTFY